MTQAGQTPLPLVVLISGSGSNLQAIIDACASGQINAEIKAVISNKADVFGLKRAQRANIPTHALDHSLFGNRQSFDRALKKLIDSYQPQLVVLAGFMRILTEEFVNHYLGRMLNIHPSLLPNFQGLNTHKRACESGIKEHGVSVHFVTPELDGGPVVNRAIIEVASSDTPESLSKRVLEEEHRIYPEAIGWFADGRLQLNGNQAMLDDTPIPQLEKSVHED